MAKKPQDDDERPGRSGEAPGHNKPEPKHEPAGGSGGSAGAHPISNDDTLTEQEKIAAGAEVGADPKTPYPTGNPPTAEQEAMRAAGIHVERDEKPAKKGSK